MLYFNACNIFAMKPVLPQGVQSSPSDQFLWVLCKPDFHQGIFIPLCSLKDSGYPQIEDLPVELLTPSQSISLESCKTSRDWGPCEDQLLFNYATEYGVHSWTKAANLVNQEMHDGEAVRLGKHCRERWHNHLNPQLNSNFHTESDWNASEDLKLINLQLDMGNCWSKIAKEMTGRTENSVKNRWNSLIKKARGSLKLHPDSLSAVARKLQKVLELECGLSSNSSS